MNNKHLDWSKIVVLTAPEKEYISVLYTYRKVCKIIVI